MAQKRLTISMSEERWERMEEKIEYLVENGYYRHTSDFITQAAEEKLENEKDKLPSEDRDPLT